MVPPTTTVFVDNLTPNISLEKLWQAFHCYGEISHIRIARKRRPHSDRRFAFVYFRRGQDASSAIKSANGKEIDGLHIRVEKARPRLPSHGISNSHSAPTKDQHCKQPSPRADSIKAESANSDGIHSPSSPLIRLKQSGDKLSKLQKSVVFRAGFKFDTMSVKKKFEKWGSVEKVIRLCPENFLIILGSKEEQQSILGLKPHWNIRPWSMIDHPDRRIASIIIRGIPLPSWSLDNIKLIASSVGKVVRVLESPYPDAWVEVETEHFTSISSEFFAELNDSIIPIGISEVNGNSPQVQGSQIFRSNNDLAHTSSNGGGSLSDSPSDSHGDKGDSNRHACSDSDTSLSNLDQLGFIRLLEFWPEDCALAELSSRMRSLETSRFQHRNPHESPPHTPTSALASIVADSDPGKNSLEPSVAPQPVFRKFPIDEFNALSGEHSLAAEIEIRDGFRPSSLIEKFNMLDANRRNAMPIHDASGEQVNTFQFPNILVHANLQHLQPVTPSTSSPPLPVQALLFPAQSGHNTAQSIAPIHRKSAMDNATTASGGVVTNANHDPGALLNDADAAPNDAAQIIPFPNDIPEFMHKYYKIGATLMDMEVASTIHPETVACLGFGKASNYHIPNRRWP